MTADLRVVRWSDSRAPTEEAVRALLNDEDLSPYRWSNGPGYRYPAHSHAYDKIVYVVSGSIVFGLPQEGQRHELAAGDRLEIPAGTTHDTQVGPLGVVCLEGQR